MKWKKILKGTLAAAMLFSNASVANLTALAKETAVVSLESARETLGTLMNEAIEKVNIEKDGISFDPGIQLSDIVCGCLLYTSPSPRDRG